MQTAVRERISSVRKLNIFSFRQVVTCWHGLRRRVGSVKVSRTAALP
jgi:hypothetical protein